MRKEERKKERKEERKKEGKKERETCIRTRQQHAYHSTRTTHHTAHHAVQNPTLMLLPFGIRSTSRPSLDWHDQVRSMASSYGVYIGVYIGCLEVYVVFIWCVYMYNGCP